MYASEDVETLRAKGRWMNVYIFFLLYYYFTLFYPTGFKGFLYFTVLNKLTIPKSFFFLF
jgi:hypothetical protein